MNVLLLFIFLTWGFVSSQSQCAGYESCHPTDPNKLNVHIIPHSHDDMGWLETVDGYYESYVRNIISTVVEELQKNPDRRYSQVETGFFWIWWQEQNDETKDAVRKLVELGQLEIVNAAWSMNDEACTHYQSIIDGFTVGIHTIRDLVGECGKPKIGWQIDPFGHSREHASIVAQLGYEGLFFWRIDKDDRERRTPTQNLETIWKGSNNLNATVFTGIFPQSYFQPDSFCFDIRCYDMEITDNNVQERAQQFQNVAKDYATHYKTNNILITMGGDFHYSGASKNYKNMDALINGFNGNDEVNVIYSTPSCYLKAVNEDAVRRNIHFEEKTDDFFPYSDGIFEYWSGYFSSRQNLKRFERLGNNILQGGKQLGAILNPHNDSVSSSLSPLKIAMGIAQHHDAITGTSKQFVANDYARLLTEGVDESLQLFNTAIERLLSNQSENPLNLQFEFCLLSNVSICVPAESERFVITIYNPLARPITHYVRIPVPGNSYIVRDLDGNELESDILNDIIENSKVLLFKSSDLPPLGASLYYIEEIPDNKPMNTPKPIEDDATTSVEIDPDTGLLKSVTINGKTLNISQDFLTYKALSGGAYVFAATEDAELIRNDSVNYEIISRNLVTEIHQNFTDWIKQIIRIYPNKNYIEFDWLVGPIDNYHDLRSREIITRFTVDGFNNDGVFYTDSNGRELIKRELNQRIDYNYTSSIEPIASNYYPVTSKILIRDLNDNLEVAVLNDRAQGGSSLRNGEIELMIHRRMSSDDSKGVQEILNDFENDQPIIARGRHFLTFGNIEDDEDEVSIAAQERILALEKLLEPLVLLANSSSQDLTFENVQQFYLPSISGLTRPLPDNVNLLTLELLREDTVIIRLEHILEKDEDSELSQPVDVDLENLFSFFTLRNLQETTLGANELLSEVNRFVWKFDNGEQTEATLENDPVIDDHLITLQPMQIRTFVANLVSLSN